MSGIPLILTDTGMEEKGGSILYARAGSPSYSVTIPSGQLNIEMDYIGTNYEGKVYNSVDAMFYYTGNRIESMNPVRFTIQCLVPSDDLVTLQALLQMGQTFGLKKITGGMNTILALDLINNEDSYVIIKSFRVSEVLGTATNQIRVTIQLERV